MTLPAAAARASADIDRCRSNELVLMSGNSHLASALCRGGTSYLNNYVCELVQEQIGQVLAKICALKAWLNQPIIRHVQVKYLAAPVPGCRCALAPAVDMNRKAAAIGGTDGQTDTRSLHRPGAPCTAYYAGSANKE